MNSSIFPWKTLAIASAGLIILFIGGFLISGRQPVQSQQTAKAYKSSVSTTSGGTSTVTAPNKSTETKAIATINKPHLKPHLKSAKTADTASKTTLSAPIAATTTPLDEMVVMGMAAKAEKSGDTEIHPKIGWANFNDYLKEKAVSPDKKAGVVKVAFTVNDDGYCSNFKIESGLSKAADRKAIQIIKDGSLWVSNDETKPTTVNIEFHK